MSPDFYSARGAHAGGALRHAGCGDDEGPVVEAVVVLHGVLESTPPIHLLQGDLLGDNLFQVGLGDLELPLHGLLPVDAREEGVVLDLVGAALARPQALVGVPIEQGDQEVARLIGQVVGQLQGPVLDVRVQLLPNTAPLALSETYLLFE